MSKIFCNSYYQTSSPTGQPTGQPTSQPTARFCTTNEYRTSSNKKFQCILCPNGYAVPSVDTIGTDKSVCTLCAGGYEGTSINGASGCVSCPIGKYSPGGNGAICTSCNTGYTTETSNTIGLDQSSCNICSIGYYSSTGSATGLNTGCIQCNEGYTTKIKKTVGNNVSVCLVCNFGYYGSTTAVTLQYIQFCIITTVQTTDWNGSGDSC